MKSKRPPNERNTYSESTEFKREDPSEIIKVELKIKNKTKEIVKDGYILETNERHYPVSSPREEKSKFHICTSLYKQKKPIERGKQQN